MHNPQVQRSPNKAIHITIGIITILNLVKMFYDTWEANQQQNSTRINTNHAYESYSAILILLNLIPGIYTLRELQQRGNEQETSSRIYNNCAQSLKASVLVFVGTLFEAFCVVREIVRRFQGSNGIYPFFDAVVGIIIITANFSIGLDRALSSDDGAETDDASHQTNLLGSDDGAETDDASRQTNLLGSDDDETDNASRRLLNP